MIDEQLSNDLISAYAPLYFYVSYFTANEPGLTDDIVNKTYERAIHNADKLKTYSNLQAALKSISKYIFLEDFRKNEKESEAIKSHYDLSEQNEEDIFYLLRSEENLKELRHAIYCLKPVLRRVIVLRYYLNIPFAEISRSLDIPYTTIVSQHDKALGQLRAYLDGNVEDFISIPGRPRPTRFYLFLLQLYLAYWFWLRC